jgi:hypothetical protein
MINVYIPLARGPLTLPSPWPQASRLCYWERDRVRGDFGSHLRRYFMAKELTCPICDADIPLDGDETSGDLVLCSYCNMTFKMLKTMEDWTLTEDFEE